MEKAIDRISLAIAQGEKIMVYGDYDVDGTTAVALTYNFFGRFTENITYYIPDRHKEGYGISIAGIDFAKQNGYSLIIALDCGIRSIDKIDYANTLGIDFIICDHHLPGDEIPVAVAVLDPKRKDCEYPFKELSGCESDLNWRRPIALRMIFLIHIMSNTWTYVWLVLLPILFQLLMKIG
jgi:single-stranded-DNA-specific exonuclease